jgi:hypothetical protein
MPRAQVVVREAFPEEGGGLELGAAFPWVVEVHHQGAPVARIGAGVRPRLEEGLHARGYDQMEEATVVVIPREGALPGIVRTCVAVSKLTVEGKEGP